MGLEFKAAFLTGEEERASLSPIIAGEPNPETSWHLGLSYPIVHRREVQAVANFGIGRHAHTDAAFLSILFTLMTYCVKWLVGFTFPEFIAVLPTFMLLFAGFYVILFAVFLIVWSRR